MIVCALGLLIYCVKVMLNAAQYLVRGLEAGKLRCVVMTGSIAAGA